MLPLVLVVIASVLGAYRGEDTAADLAQLFPGYPIRIDLAEVERITAREDLTQRPASTAVQAPDGVMAFENLLQGPELGPLGEEGGDPSPASRAGGLVDRRFDAAPTGREGTAGFAPGSVMALDYDLAGGPQSVSALQVRKDVQREGRIIGQVQIRIDNNSAIYVAREDVLGILPVEPDETGSLRGDFVGLADLREAGINLRYDPVNDRLVLRE